MFFVEALLASPREPERREPVQLLVHVPPGEGLPELRVIVQVGLFLELRERGFCDGVVRHLESSWGQRAEAGGNIKQARRVAKNPHPPEKGITCFYRP
jgi:hypothetical protein